jgi:hypothetical protein
MNTLSHRRERALVGTTAIPTVVPVMIHGRRGRSRKRRAWGKVDLDTAARDMEN